MSERNIFVTVGTTRFDKLIAAATSKAALAWMVSEGFTSLTIQYGTGDQPQINNDPNAGISIKAYSFQPSLDTDMKKADFILSHAGAGTVMEALKLKKKLAVVINTLLMNNHQTELASAMADRGHLFMVENPEKLDDMVTWSKFAEFQPNAYEKGKKGDFSTLLGSHLGFDSSKIC